MSRLDLLTRACSVAEAHGLALDEPTDEELWLILLAVSAELERRTPEYGALTSRVNEFARRGQRWASGDVPRDLAREMGWVVELDEAEHLRAAISEELDRRVEGVDSLREAVAEIIADLDLEGGQHLGGALRSAVRQRDEARAVADALLENLGRMVEIIRAGLGR